jgi:hypothetical protein
MQIILLVQKMKKVHNHKDQNNIKYKHLIKKQMELFNKKCLIELYNLKKKKHEILFLQVTDFLLFF